MALSPALLFWSQEIRACSRSADWVRRRPPPPGYFDRRGAQEALEAILTDARRGAIELARTGVTFEQAAIEWLRWSEHERGWKRATLVDRRSLLRCHLLPEFGALPINQITNPARRAWKIRWPAEHDARRQGAKLLLLHSIMERARKAYDLPRNPVADVDRIRVSYDRRASTSTRPRRSTRWHAPRRPSRTPRSSSPPRSPAYGAANSSRCAGATSTSRALDPR